MAVLFPVLTVVIGELLGVATPRRNVSNELSASTEVVGTVADVAEQQGIELPAPIRTLVDGLAER